MAETIKLRSSDSDLFSVSQDVALCVPSRRLPACRCLLWLGANALARCGGVQHEHDGEEHAGGCGALARRALRPEALRRRLPAFPQYPISWPCGRVR